MGLRAREALDALPSEPAEPNKVLPLLVHRTGRGAVNALHAHALTPRSTTREEALGIPPAVYFSLGVPAYPHGNAVLLFSQRALDGPRYTFSAFDSGSLLQSPAVVRLPSEVNARAYFEEHAGQGLALGAFYNAYGATHVASGKAYVDNRKRLDLDPAYHGLRGVDARPDRRLWAIEIQAYDPLAISESGGLREIVLEREGLALDLPDPLRLLAVETPPDVDFEDFVFQRIHALMGAGS